MRVTAINSITHLQEYASFLMDNHLDQLVETNIQRVKEVNLPLFSLFASLSEEELFQYSKARISELLQSIIRGEQFVYHQHNLQKWRENKLPGINKDEINLMDLLLSPLTRKHALIKLLPLFTKNFELYEKVIGEIEFYYSEILGSSIKTYIEIQQGELKKERDYYHSIINNTIDGISAYDKDLKVILWNKAIESRTGIKKEDIIGRPLLEVLPAYKGTPDIAAMHQALKGEKIYLRDMPYKGGKEGYYESDLIPLMNAEGEVFGLLAVSRDVTEKKKNVLELESKNVELSKTLKELRDTQTRLLELNEQLESKVAERTSELLKTEEDLRKNLTQTDALNKQLTQRQKELDEYQMKLLKANYDLSQKNQELKTINDDLDNFIYVASHDLRSPIVNLEGLYLRLQKQIAERMDEKDNQLFELSWMSLKRLRQTIDDLTEISKVQKQVEEHNEEVSFSEVINSFKDEMADLLIKTQAIIHEDLRVQKIMFPRKNIRSILYNLLSNALKYRNENKQVIIHISTRAENNKVVLSVQDNGLGIHENHLPKLFSMFKRFHSSSIEGSGIGLYIIKRIIDNNGGNIKVDSQIDKGTCFTITINTQIVS